MSQYFTENFSILTNERKLALDVFGHKLQFLTNNGLFSCNKVDDASLLLVQSMPACKGFLLDIGCGYGVIGIILAKINEISLFQSDINRVALEYAKKNAALNSVETTLIHSDGFKNITGNFDIITLNPPIHAGKEVMYRLYEESAAFLNPGGSFYVVIQKKHGAESSIKKLQSIYQHVHILYKKKGVYVLQCIVTG